MRSGRLLIFLAIVALAMGLWAAIAAAAPAGPDSDMRAAQAAIAEKTPTLTGSAVRPPGKVAPAAHPEAVLWDQPLSTVNQAAYVDQEFPDFAAYSSFLADDFVNPNPWNIFTIFVPGDGWNGFTTLFNATALTWQIYADCAGVPCGDPSGGGNPPVWTLTLPPGDPQVVISNGTPGGYPSNTTLNLAAPINLSPGHWWLVFYPTMTFSPSGQYGRQAADTANGYVAQFINPGGGFGYGTVWQNWTVLGPTQQDIAFRLQGDVAPSIGWDKYVNGEPWMPGMQITVQTSDTIEVVEVLHLMPMIPPEGSPLLPAMPSLAALPLRSSSVGQQLAAERAGEAPEMALPPAAPVERYTPEAVLWDNGPLVTHAGACSGQDASRLQGALGMTIYGFGHQFSVGNRMADDFTITVPGGWQIDTITFFAYQTNAPTDPSPITGVYYQIWNGPPNDPGSSVVFGDLVTNRLLSSTFTNIQRDWDSGTCANNRYIFADVASAGVALPPGTYWLDWMTDGSLASGPWAPPITILGQTTTGNGLQYLSSSGAWQAALDVGQQDLPFVIEGTTGPHFAQIETWDPARLRLLDWAATGGEVIITPGRVEWGGEIVAPTTITLTKWFHVEPCDWTETVLWEELWLDQVELEQRPVVINKLAPVLWIDALGGGPVFAGQPANFTLLFGNQGGYENGVMIRNEFPPGANFANAYPYPDRWDPGGLWAEWDIGDLPMDAQGSIEVEVFIHPTVPPSTTFEIWDGIFDHTGELRDWVIIMFHVEPPYRYIYLPVVYKNYGYHP